MTQAWDRVDNDPEVRVCILTGAGGYFCAGADLKAMNKRAPGDQFSDGSYDPSVIPGLLKGRRLTKPLIAAVEGPQSPVAPRSCKPPISVSRVRAPNSVSLR